jgi:hypothetical protein
MLFLIVRESLIPVGELCHDFTIQANATAIIRTCEALDALRKATFKGDLVRLVLANFQRVISILTHLNLLLFTVNTIIQIF